MRTANFGLKLRVGEKVSHLNSPLFYMRSTINSIGLVR